MKYIIFSMIALFLVASTFGGSLEQAKSAVAEANQLSAKSSTKILLLSARSLDYEKVDQWQTTGPELFSNSDPVQVKVFLNQKQPIKVVFYFSSRSGDWSSTIEYFFHNNGNSAFIYEEYQTLTAFDVDKNAVVSGLFIFEKKYYFDKDGKEISVSKKVYNSKTKEEIPQKWIHTIQVPYYKDTQSLPFISLINTDINMKQ